MATSVPNLPPAVLAQIDQVAANWNDALDGMITQTRIMLDTADPGIVMQAVRLNLDALSDEHSERIVWALATALVRLGQQGEVPDGS